MTGSEIMHAFARWRGVETHDRFPLSVYPLWISQASRWYVRERFPGTRVWRAEEDGGFTLLTHPSRPCGRDEMDVGGW